MIRRATVDEIEAHLLTLGGGNHEDNMKAIRKFPHHYLLALDEQEFMELVFLQAGTVSKIVPKGRDRRLKVVALRASQLSPHKANLGNNWDIAATLARFKALYSQQRDCYLPALVLRDTHGSECHWAPKGWYLQDGSHRALAYCIAILTGEREYYPQLAFCASSRHINEST